MKKMLLVLLGLGLLLMTSTAWGYPFPLPDTGQTKCYNDSDEIPCPAPGEAFYGQDGNYLINPPSYTKLDADGNDLPDTAASWVMVRDNVTGLIWEVKTDDGSIHDKDDQYSWQDAQDVFITQVNAENFGGHSDWRMPTPKELASITMLGRYDPAADTAYFPNCRSSHYWSSSPLAGGSGYAWYVDFNYGLVGNSNKTDNHFYVRCVRAGPSGSLDHLTLNEDGTVTDTSTGLTWQQTGPESSQKTWEEALAYAEGLVFAGYDDWRLPNARELQSIVDYSKNDPAIDTNYFPNCRSPYYWSSSPYAYASSFAWDVNFSYGYVHLPIKTSHHYVRCVRAGPSRSLGHLIISSPAQGSIHEIGGTLPITWDTQGITGNVAISLSRQGGKTGTFETIAESTENDGAYEWTVSGSVSVNCALKIEPLSDPAKGTTQSLFTIIAAPAVTTTEVSSIASTGASSGGNVTDDGGSSVTVRGVCWSMSPNPTISDSHTEDGAGIGSFTSSVTGLTSGTTYHVRAYATNSAGTGYGDDISFNTAPSKPTNVQVTPGNQSVSLTWNANAEPSLAGYNVYRSQSMSGTYSKVNLSLLETASCNDTGLTNFLDYYYKVSAVDTNGNESSLSDAVKAVPSVSGPTNVSGFISQNTTWTLQGSPYAVTGSVLVNVGVKLTIDPGVTVKFDGGRLLQVNGELIARGYSDRKILITSNQLSPAPGDWGYILFSGTSTDAAYDVDGSYTGGSILEYCTVEYAGGASGSNNGAVRMDNAHPFINHCIIQKNSASGINGWNLSGTLRMENCDVTDNSSSGGGGGIRVSGGTVHIIGNTITRNSAVNGGGGIWIESESGRTATIMNNTISGNAAAGEGGGVYTGNSSGTYEITQNAVSGNSALSGGGICSKSGTVNINSNNVTVNQAQNNGGGIHVSCDAGITNNVISDNAALNLEGGGIYSTSYSDPSITNNTISGNRAATASAVTYSDGSKVFGTNTITGNTATGPSETCTVILGSPYTANPDFSHNNIFWNTATYELSNANDAGSDVNASNNWWGTASDAEIQGKIYDGFDAGNRGFVFYAPFLSTLNTGAPISPPANLSTTIDGASAILTWDANPESDVAGYRVCYDTDGPDIPYENCVDVGNTTTHTISGLAPGPTYHVGVTAYDVAYSAANDDPDTIVNENQTSGNESWYKKQQIYLTRPPYAPSAPSPDDTALYVPVDTTLSWTGGDPDDGDTVTYDVYFGAIADPPLVTSGQGSTTYDPGVLVSSTDYWWYIVARDNHGAVMRGPTWRFFTDGDSDYDGMLDSWEKEHFGNLDPDGTGDADGDGLLDGEEYENNTDPNKPDSDGDGMPDGWEVDNNLNPKADDAGEDPDGDKFTNGREYQDETDPNNSSSHLVFPPVTGRIPDTGQTKCYDNSVEISCPEPGGDFYGQDASYTINPPSYMKMDVQGNYLADSATSWAMVRDNVTGLIWEVKTDDGSVHDKDNTYTWYDSNPATNGGNAGTPGEGTDTEDFINALNAEGFGGDSDWRLPTIKELASIVDLWTYNAAINTAYFPNTLSSYYWSSTTVADNTGNAWLVYFYEGDDVSYHKSYSYYVRAVRGGQAGSFDPLVINGDGTVTDTTTGLMWQQGVGSMTWDSAISHCEALTLAGYDDWRLPNRRELRSIVDYTTYGPAIDTEYFPGTLSSNYWSSTTSPDSTYAWLVHFFSGNEYNYYKSDSYYVRAVRRGQTRLLGHLVISAPVQASTWNVGDAMPITWDTEGITGNVAITISRQGGKSGTYETIIQSTENDGTYDWTVTGPVSVNCALRIEPLSDPSKGTTQSLFTIKTLLPTATISGTPTSPTRQTTATLTVGGDGIVAYQYKLDAGDYGVETPVSNPIEVTGLGDGTHTVHVIGKHTSEIWQSVDAPTTATWAVDTAGPTVTGLTDDPNPTRSKTWTWDADEPATFRYVVDQNPSWTPSGTFGDVKTATRSGTDGTWYLHVQAKDPAGNEGGIVTVSALLDNLAPVAAITGTPDSPTNQNGATLTVGQQFPPTSSLSLSFNIYKKKEPPTENTAGNYLNFLACPINS